MLRIEEQISAGELLTEMTYPVSVAVTYCEERAVLAMEPSPYQLCEMYSQDIISRERLLLELGNFQYASFVPGSKPDVLVVTLPALWDDVSKAASGGLIDDFIYHEAYTGWHLNKFLNVWPDIFRHLSDDQTLMLVHPLAGLLRLNNKLTRVEVNAFAEHMKGNLEGFSLEELQVRAAQNPSGDDLPTP